MLPSLFFFVFLEISVLAFPSWASWFFWFILALAPYFRRTRSLKKLGLAIAFLVWVAFISRLYLPVGPGLLLWRARITTHFLIAYLSVLYFLSLEFLEPLDRGVISKLETGGLKAFFYLSVYFLTSILFFSGKFSSWWFNSFFLFAFLLFFSYLVIKKTAFKERFLISFLLLEVFFSLSFLSFIPEVKALVFSLPLSFCLLVQGAGSLCKF